MLFTHAMRLPASFARLSAGISMAARMAIMAMTTSNSMSVNAITSRPAPLPAGKCFVLNW